MTRFTRFAIVIGIVLGAAASSIAAYGLWSATGTGSGSATARSAVAATVTAVAPAGCLFPGNSTACPVQFTVTNSNPYAVKFTGLTAGTVTGVPGDDCTASNVTAVSGSQTIDITVPANTTSATQTSPALLSMVAAAPDSCQGDTFTVVLTLAGAQV